MRTAQLLNNILIMILLAALVYIATNPFVLLDTKAFLSSMRYESSVALGTLPVFYTGAFFGSIPVVFQFMYVYPFLLGPLMTLLFLLACGYLCFRILHYRDRVALLLSAFFLVLFLSQAFLFVKWTRYMVPTLPFIYLIIALAAMDLFTVAKRRRGLIYWSLTMMVLSITNTIFAFSYFITAFVQPDTRIQASAFAQQTIQPNATILSEVYDLGIIPFNNHFQDITLFNFYDLDSTSPDYNQETLKANLAKADYVLLPSQRLWQVRLMNTKRFPQGAAFYSSLHEETGGFTKIYQTPCDILCNIAYLGNPLFGFEQTASVFDRPTVMIFKKL